MAGALRAILEDDVALRTEAMDEGWQRRKIGRGQVTDNTAEPWTAAFLIWGWKCISVLFKPLLLLLSYWNLSTISYDMLYVVCLFAFSVEGVGEGNLEKVMSQKITLKDEWESLRWWQMRNPLKEYSFSSHT